MSKPIPVGYALASLPRYTSYPTAPHFAPMQESDYRGWLGGIAPDDPLSLYVHIPFCASLCWYCGCHTAVTRKPERIARYGAALVQEATLLAAALPANGGVAAIHLGGGTPSSLGAPGLRALFAGLRSSFAFRPDVEIAVELDPRVLDAEIITALAEAGVTRASLGVQDIDPGVQARIGRIQPEAEVEAAVTGLRSAGITAINMDLMYGLPGQTEDQVIASARFAAALDADRVAVFGYAHVPWMKSNQNAIVEAELPGVLERIRQAEAAQEALSAVGFETIGLDHFARPTDPMAVAARTGRLRRNFQGYTTDTAPALLGIGASAIGAVPAGYVQNEPDERRYVAAIEAGTLPVRRGLALTKDDRLRRDCIERVMCDFALDLGALPPELVESTRPGLEALEADGIVHLAPDMLWVSLAGRRHVRHVAACFDSYLAKGVARHSKAV
jgi:oxygen-independent coproporphyrinogen-3 oxidase